MSLLHELMKLLDMELLKDLLERFWLVKWLLHQGFIEGIKLFSFIKTVEIIEPTTKTLSASFLNKGIHVWR